MFPISRDRVCDRSRKCERALSPLDTATKASSIPFAPRTAASHKLCAHSGLLTAPKTSGMTVVTLFVAVFRQSVGVHLQRGSVLSGERCCPY